MFCPRASPGCNREQRRKIKQRGLVCGGGRRQINRKSNPLKIAGLIKRLEPLALKLSGRLPLCPWPSVWFSLDPRTLGVHPPEMQIEVTGEDGAFKKLRFNGRHESWFPAGAQVGLELWNEYLSVFWPHPANAHYYLAHGTIIRPGDVVIDCGGCEGFFVIQALEAGAAKVICIEPSETMAACLKKTFAAEIKTGRVVVENVAAGVMVGTARFAFDELNPFSGRLESAIAAVNIPVTTLAKLCADLQLTRVDFIKMDIEGAEIQAVEGALPVLDKFHPRLAITTYHRPFDYRALHALVTVAGYRQICSTGLGQRGDGIYRPVMLHAEK